jgi:hypothetical protein
MTGFEIAGVDLFGPTLAAQGWGTHFGGDAIKARLSCTAVGVTKR